MQESDVGVGGQVGFDEVVEINPTNPFVVVFAEVELFLEAAAAVEIHFRPLAKNNGVKRTIHVRFPETPGAVVLVLTVFVDDKNLFVAQHRLVHVKSQA